MQISLGFSAIAVAILIVGAGFGTFCCLKGKTALNLRKENYLRDSNTEQFKQMFLADQVGPFPKSTFTYEELAYATNGFSELKLLGDGGFGTVYEGTLYNGQKVAVKRLYPENTRRLDQFLNEITILSTMNHPNLVKLYGFCCENQDDLLLVYEYVSNGTLADNLHGDAGKGLLWETRLCIALETARALAYLHSCESPILHRDVKSSNILLDQNFHVKVADFGLSRLVPVAATHISTCPQGTPGYVDPDYHHCYQLTDKSDVYSFGVVLVELISGKMPVDMSRDHMEINLSSLAVAKIQTGVLDELIDPYLEVSRYREVKEMVTRVAEVAFQCLALAKEDRPRMKDVLQVLEDITESGYGTLGSGKKVEALLSCDSFDANETSQLMNKCRVLGSSPTSVQEKWPSSSNSIDASLTVGEK